MVRSDPVQSIAVQQQRWHIGIPSPVQIWWRGVFRTGPDPESQSVTKFGGVFPENPSRCNPVAVSQIRGISVVQFWSNPVPCRWWSIWSQIQLHGLFRGNPAHWNYHMVYEQSVRCKIRRISIQSKNRSLMVVEEVPVQNPWSISIEPSPRPPERIGYPVSVSMVQIRCHPAHFLSVFWCFPREQNSRKMKPEYTVKNRSVELQCISSNPVQSLFLWTQEESSPIPVQEWESKPGGKFEADPNQNPGTTCRWAIHPTRNNRSEVPLFQFLPFNLRLQYSFLSKCFWRLF